MGVIIAEIIVCCARLLFRHFTQPPALLPILRFICIFALLLKTKGCQFRRARGQ